MNGRLLAALAARPLLLDGAMGTRLIRLGRERRIDDPALWNLSHPEAVRDAELRYAQRYRTPRVNPRRVVIEVRIERVLGSSELLDRSID